MVRSSLIRRLRLFVRRYGWDGAFAFLFAIAVLFGGGPALAGLAHFAETLPSATALTAPADATPAMPAVAKEAGTQLAMAGFAGPSSYSPQVLFPIQSHSFPSWLQPSSTRAPTSPSRPARSVIAICIDDLGEDIAGTDKAMALPRAVALSFLPYAETTPFLAVEAARKGHEILAHVPMEALGHVDPGPMALVTGAPDIAARLDWNLARVPGLSGINNHEGSKFTADAQALIPVAEALAARHLFFFDSRTGADSKVVAVAQSFGVASAARDIFLDDTPDAAAIDRQLAALAEEARAHGVAIAIGHPHDLTLKLLAAWLAQDHGVTLVPLSEAIRLKSGSQTLASR